MGEPHLKPAFFELGVLERYFNDPKFHFNFDDYSGKIIIKDEFYSDDNHRDDIFLQSFGLGYDDDDNRVIVVYLRYLSKLSTEHQLYWYSFEVNSPCKMLKEYYENTILGNWVFGQSIYTAFLKELEIINSLSEIIGKPKLFKNDFRKQRPREFSFFLVPTKHNLERFTLLLDKMVSDNIDKKFFKGDLDMTFEEQRKDGKIEIRHKGTLNLLKEWLEKVAKVSADGISYVMNPLFDLRKKRQEPAHKITRNLRNKEFVEKQNKLIENIYLSVRGIREVLMSHPKCKQFELPDWIQNNEIKIY